MRLHLWLTLLLSACAAPGQDSAADIPPDADSDTADPFAGLTEPLEDGVDNGNLPGYQFVVQDAGGNVLFASAGGDFDADQAIPLDSSIKPVTAAVVLTLVDSGDLSLDSTLRQEFGWRGAPGQVTVRDLLAFTSGFPGGAFCITPPPRLRDGDLVVPEPRRSLEACAESIRDSGVSATPGTTFRYGAAHQHILAYLVEETTGRSFEAVFQERVRNPAGLSSSDIRYANDRVAAGAVGHAGAMATLFNHLGRDGSLLEGGPAGLLDPMVAQALFADDTRANEVTIEESPWDRIGQVLHFGLGVWIDCEDFADTSTCIWLGSGGNGTTVWIDPASQTVGALVLYQGSFMGYLDGYTYMQTLLAAVREARDETR